MRLGAPLGDEIDLQGRVWRIPAQRMKAGRGASGAPEQAQALDVLGEASALRDAIGPGVSISAEGRRSHVGHDADQGAA